jgi:hypothetical protein
VLLVQSTGDTGPAQRDRRGRLAGRPCVDEDDESLGAAAGDFESKRALVRREQAQRVRDAAAKDRDVARKERNIIREVS